MFQSPKSGKFESNTLSMNQQKMPMTSCSNPLNRGNLNQIKEGTLKKSGEGLFQSPKSGKFESNIPLGKTGIYTADVPIP